MKTQLLFVAVACAIVWSSCSKMGIKPTSPATPSHVNFNSTVLATVPLRVLYGIRPDKLNGSHDITISGKAIIGGTVPPITLTNCYNVHITQNSLGNSADVGIYLIN